MSFLGHWITLLVRDTHKHIFLNVHIHFCADLIRNDEFMAGEENIIYRDVKKSYPLKSRLPRQLTRIPPFFIIEMSDSEHT